MSVFLLFLSIYGKLCVLPWQQCAWLGEGCKKKIPHFWSEGEAHPLLHIMERLGYQQVVEYAHISQQGGFVQVLPLS